MTVRYYATIDESSQAQIYTGIIVDPPDVSLSLTDPLYGITDYGDLSFTLLNTDGQFEPSTIRNLRGRNITIKLLEGSTGTLYSAWSGKVQRAVPQSNGEVRIEATSFVPAVLDTLVPTGSTITTSLFPNAIQGELGKTAPIIFGAVSKVKCLYVNDGVGGNYDYVISRGTGQAVLAVWRDDVNQATTAIGSGAESFRLIPSGDYTVSAGGHYSSYWTLRFTDRQISDNGTLVGIYVDVQGFQAEKHPVRGIQYLLSIDTASWGLGQSVDTASFNAAVAVFDAQNSPDTIVLDTVIGAGGQQRPAQEYLREWLMIVGGNLRLNSSGQWQITIDQLPSTTAGDVGSGPHDGEQNVVDAGEVEWQTEDERAYKIILKYRLFQPTGTYQLELTRTLDSSGRIITITLPSITNSRSADRILDKIAKRLYYAQRKVKNVRMSMEGWALNAGDWVAYTNIQNGCFRDIFKISRIIKAINGVTMDLEGTSGSILQYSAGTVPAEPPPTPIDSPPPSAPPAAGILQEFITYVITNSLPGSTSYQSVADYNPIDPPAATLTGGNDLYLQGMLELLVLNSTSGNATVRLRDTTSGNQIEVGPKSFGPNNNLFQGFTVYTVSFSAGELTLQQNGITGGSHTFTLDFKTSFADQEVFYGSLDTLSVGSTSSAYIYMKEFS